MQGNDEKTSRFYGLKNMRVVWGGKSFKEYAHGQSLSLGKEVDKKV